MAIASIPSLALTMFVRQHFNNAPEAELFITTVWLPFGVKLLTVWLYRAKAILYLLPTFLVNAWIYLIFSAREFDWAFLLHVSLTNTVLIYVLFELARTIHTSRSGSTVDFLPFRYFIAVGSVASLISNVFFVQADMFYVEVWPIPYVQRVLSDLLGLFFVLLILKLGLRFFLNTALAEALKR